MNRGSVPDGFVNAALLDAGSGGSGVLDVFTTVVGDFVIGVDLSAQPDATNNGTTMPTKAMTMGRAGCARGPPTAHVRDVASSLTLAQPAK